MAATRTEAWEPDYGNALEMMKLLWALDHGLQVLSKKMGRELRITGPQRLVLKAIKASPGTSAGELAGYLHIDPSTLTGVLQRLERRRLIRRTVDPEDARRVRLDVTSRGGEFTTIRNGTVETAVLRALRTITPESAAGAQAFLFAAISEMERESRFPDERRRPR